MKVLLVLCFVCSLVYVLGNSAVVSSCSSSSAHFKISSLNITSNPQVGQNASIVAVGTLDESVTSGTFKVKATYDLIPVWSDSGSACGNYSLDLPDGFGIFYVNGLNCPTRSGALTLTEKVLIKENPPFKGTLDAKVTIDDQNGQEIACIDVKIKFDSLDIPEVDAGTKKAMIQNYVSKHYGGEQLSLN
eukprot:CAMPEP_0174270738 /NCGR_PEP_ID=MMETSP0439-20130205/45579_1 /TAXON_ID=0 /ORGANISM="Stereomyxa ramosa, Strain Chinc5" /LENGTH=188 /DNA_ID=CAMNT_0015360257 /DNA_START=45 /DNA_END=611 /DNA_ORIENTATION=+